MIKDKVSKSVANEPQAADSRSSVERARSARRSCAGCAASALARREKFSGSHPLGRLLREPEEDEMVKNCFVVWNVLVKAYAFNTGFLNFGEECFNLVTFAPP